MKRIRDLSVVFRLLLAVVIGILLFPATEKTDARRINTRIVKPKAVKKSSAERLLIVSFADSLRKINFTGYDKPAGSTYETFFVSNNNDVPMRKLALDIEYLTPDSLQLHRRSVSLECDVPAGETRMVSVRSWDRQNSFHYVRSKDSRKGTQGYVVIFYPQKAVFAIPLKASQD